MIACDHLEFSTAVTVHRLTDGDDGPVTGFAADFQIRCRACGAPLIFPNLPIGVSQTGPTVNVDRTELRVPLEMIRPDGRSN